VKALLVEEVKNAVRAVLKTELRKGLITGVTTDSRTLKPGDLFIALRGEQFDGHNFIDSAVNAGAKAVLVDRNIPLTDAVRDAGISILKVDDTREALGLLARFYRRNLLRSVRIAGITGTNGKTTTREMIYWAMSRYKSGYRSPSNFNNDIGVPLTLLGIEPDHEFAVVEMGSNAPGEIAALSRIVEPDIALITCVGPGHLEGLGDVDGVSVEKVSITTGLKDHGVVICGLDHETTLDRLRAQGQHLISFGLDESADVCALDVELDPGRIRFTTNDRAKVEVPIGGIHTVKNTLAALSVCRRLGITSQQFAEAIRQFQPVPGRMQRIDARGITIIDDCYNANPASMAAAMLELSNYTRAGRRILVVGDMYELGAESETYHCELGRAIAQSNIDVLYAVGPLAALTAQAALQAGMGRADVQKSITSKRLARLIKSMLRDEDVILVKGSRAMKLELVVQALQRYRGGRPIVVRASAAKALPARRKAREKSKV
jgi:UDP-N-acetylmuramoyl-tripeptide--D-alanyl-D-alanine ligase